MTSPQNKVKGILLLSAGAKVATARCAKAAAAKRGLALHVSDHSKNIPTRHVADSFLELPSNDSPAWIDSLLHYCSTQEIGLVIPTRHSDLAHLGPARSRFFEAGIALSLSSQECLEICLQKSATSKFLSQADIPTPTTTLRSTLAQSPLAGQFPLFAKPDSGAASCGAHIVHNQEDLRKIPSEWILQSIATGQEYTANLYLDRGGKLLCAIPHARLAVESGEVTQAITKRVPTLMQACRNIAQALPAAQGIFNVQAFHDETSDSLQITDINPRIGGGYPICDAAKGRYIEWLCQEWIDESKLEPFERWTENLRMMRYRDAVFSIE